MKKAALVIGGLLLACTAAVGADTVIEEIIARINSAIITRTDLQRSREQAIQEVKDKSGGGANADAELAQREKDVLRDLIDQQLLVQKALELGITGDVELIKRLDEMRKSMGLETMDDLQKEAEKQGISYEDFKQNMRNQIVTQMVIQREVGSHIQTPPDEIKQFYESHKSDMERPETVQLSEILISPVRTSPDQRPDQLDPTALEAAQKKADNVLAMLKKGDKFEDVAKKYSDGPSAQQGGELGEFKRGTLAKELEEKTFAMKVGEITDVIRTKQGFVILKVTEHTQPGLPPLKDVQQRIEEALYYQKLQPALRDYLTKLRENAYIDIKAGFVDTGASPNQTKPVLTAADTGGEKEKAKKKKKKFLVF